MIRSVAPVLLALSTLLAGCASAATTTIAPADSPIVEASPAATFPSVPTFSPAPSPSQLAPPVSLPLGPPAFTTPVPPDAATAWKSISWRKLKADDPLAQVRSVVRWRGGFVALGAEIATGEGSRTPVWVSPDGATWRPLDTDVLGPATIVIGIGETAGGIVALTLQGGRNQCGTQTSPLNCRTPAAPLQSWTSSDATDWTAHPGPPGIALEAVGCDGCGVDVPIFRSGTPGLIAVNSGATQPTSSRVAFSLDGVAWQNLPADAFPAGFQFGDVAGFRSGFVAVGEQNVTVDGEETIRAVALSSSDGRQWVTREVPTSGLDPQAGTSAGRIMAGPEGLIVTGSNAATPGTEFWWSMVSDSTWSRLSGYPPLGVWNGQGEGSGMIPNGTLLGDGERMLAYRGGAKPAGWTSSDGRSWRTLTIGGSGPTNAGDWPLQALSLTLVGVLGTGDDGSVWFGTPG